MPVRFSGRSVSATSPLTTNAAPAVIASPNSVQSVSVVAPTSCVPPAAPPAAPPTAPPVAGSTVAMSTAATTASTHEERDSEDDDDPVHGSSALTRSPDSSSFGTKPHAQEVETSSP